MKIKIENIFSYIFFFLFVFVSLALLVSTFSTTFSQLYILLTQKGRIFDLFLYIFLLAGFGFCISALILSSWNQHYNLYYKGCITVFSLGFIFVFCFLLLRTSPDEDLLNLIFNDGNYGGFEREPYAIIIFVVMYLCFVFLPLLYLILGGRMKRNSLREFFLNLMPSINVIIYTLMGFALQGYFHKARGVYYLDLFFFLVAFFALLFLFQQEKKMFGFYERVNFALLCLGIVFFALSSRIIEEANFVGRYCFFTFAFVAWCGEWMLRFAKNRDSKSTF